ncbi:MAG: HIT domain-containing protein [Nanoarchaeota archaeon]
MENKLENCVFCNYSLDKLIRETENTITILSNPYLLKGHSLVIPKEHYGNILEVSDRDLFELIKEVKGVEKLLLEKLGVSGVDIRQNYHPFLKESKYKVNHLHFHVIPRESEYELYKKSMIYEKDVFKDLTDDDFNELKEILK